MNTIEIKELNPKIGAAGRLVFKTGNMVVTCGYCGHFDEWEKFNVSPLGEEFPHDHWGCPSCRKQWAIENREKFPGSGLFERVVVEPKVPIL